MPEVVTLYRGEDYILVEPNTPTYDNAIAHGFAPESVSVPDDGEDAKSAPKKTKKDAK